MAYRTDSAGTVRFHGGNRRRHRHAGSRASRPQLGDLAPVSTEDTLVKIAFLVVAASMATAQTPNCGPSCGTTCCEPAPCEFGHRLRDCFRNLCNRDRGCGDSCAPSCNTSCCNTPKCWTWSGSCLHRSSCTTSCWTSSCNTGCASSCDTGCNDGGCQLFGRLKGLFNRDCGHSCFSTRCFQGGCNWGCSSGCSNGSCGTTSGCGVTTMPPAGETIKDPGKKMPKSDSKEQPKTEEVRIINPPATIPAPAVNPIPVNAPAIVPPAPPVIDDNRNPF